MRIVLTLLIVGLYVIPAMAQSNESKAYERAYGHVLDADWSEARLHLRSFVEQYPQSSQADAANFWLCYSGEKMGQEQQDSFACYHDVVIYHRGSSWADDAELNLIRLGQQLAADGETRYEEVIRLLEQDETGPVKLAAMDALVRMGDDSVVDELAEMYRASSDLRLRREIVGVIGRVHTDEGQQVLRRIMTDVWERKRNGAPSTIDLEYRAVLSMLALSRDPATLRLFETITFAEQGLDEYTSLLGMYRRLPTEEGLPRILRVIDTAPNDVVRNRAAVLLAELEDPKSLKRLEALASESEDSRSLPRALMQRYLRQADEDAAASIARMAETHPFEEVRLDAAVALAQLPAELGLPYLEAVAEQSSNVEVQRALMRAYLQRQAPGDFERVADVIINGPDLHTRYAAMGELSQLATSGSPTVQRQIRELMDERDWQQLSLRIMSDFQQSDVFKVELLRMNIGIQGESGVEWLVEVAENEEQSLRVRREAVMLLTRYDNPTAKAALKRLAGRLDG
ncbi:MAG: hypothetical protein RhofKO_29160 [Rhodothermales bacterium]